MGLKNRQELKNISQSVAKSGGLGVAETAFGGTTLTLANVENNNKRKYSSKRTAIIQHAWHTAAGIDKALTLLAEKTTDKAFYNKLRHALANWYDKLLKNATSRWVSDAKLERSFNNGLIAIIAAGGLDQGVRAVFDENYFNAIINPSARVEQVLNVPGRCYQQLLALFYDYSENNKAFSNNDNNIPVASDIQTAFSKMQQEGGSKAALLTTKAGYQPKVSETFASRHYYAPLCTQVRRVQNAQGSMVFSRVTVVNTLRQRLKNLIQDYLDKDLNFFTFMFHNQDLRDYKRTEIRRLSRSIDNALTEVDDTTDLTSTVDILGRLNRTLSQIQQSITVETDKVNKDSFFTHGLGRSGDLLDDVKGAVEATKAKFEESTSPRCAR